MTPPNDFAVVIRGGRVVDPARGLDAANWGARRAPRYRLNNSLGVIVEDAIVVAGLILGGVLEACPRLKVSVA